MGQLVASPSVAKDEHDVEGCFFCFPDLSCRTHGRYKLRFVLMRIDPMNLHVGGFSPILTEVFTDVFTVYTAKDFPGMHASSLLLKALRRQGLNVSVKKGSQARKMQNRVAKKSVSSVSELDEDEDDEGLSDAEGDGYDDDIGTEDGPSKRLVGKRKADALRESDDDDYDDIDRRPVQSTARSRRPSSTFIADAIRPSNARTTSTSSHSESLHKGKRRKVP